MSTIDIILSKEREKDIVYKEIERNRIDRIYR